MSVFYENEDLKIVMSKKHDFNDLKEHHPTIAFTFHAQQNKAILVEALGKVVDKEESKK